MIVRFPFRSSTSVAQGWVKSFQTAARIWGNSANTRGIPIFVPHFYPSTDLMIQGHHQSQNTCTCHSIFTLDNRESLLPVALLLKDSHLRRFGSTLSQPHQRTQLVSQQSLYVLSDFARSHVCLAGIPSLLSVKILSGMGLGLFHAIFALVCSLPMWLSKSSEGLNVWLKKLKWIVWIKRKSDFCRLLRKACKHQTFDMKTQDYVAIRILIANVAQSDLWYPWLLLI